jgi:peptide/nickel transport system permease protein
MVALAFLVLLIAVAIAAPLLANHDPIEQDLVNRLQGPNGDHWLGTDSLGRDIFARLVYGARITLVAAAQAVGIAMLLGIPAGLLAGTVGPADKVLNVISDAVMSIPPLLLALVLVGILGPGLTNAMIAVGVIVAPRFFRVTRAAAYSVRQETYIEAAQAVGCSPLRVLWRHVLPNASGPILVQTSFAVGLAIVAEASLSFLGLGVRDPEASWGSMTQQAFQSVSETMWGIFPPSILIALTILSFSVFGDGLRDAFGRESGGR